jgi:hypothetical protein
MIDCDVMLFVMESVQYDKNAGLNMKLSTK